MGLPCELVYYRWMPSSSLTIRPPLVSGYFYPGSPEQLSRQVDLFFEKVKSVDTDGEVHGLVAPHAGYQYSGQVAASGYSTLPRHLKRFFIIAALHNRVEQFFKFALPGVDAFSTPLGVIPVSSISGELLKNPIFSEVPQAHESHVIEVHLPFLQHMFKNFEIIPVITGSTGTVDISEAAELIAPYIDDSTALIVSSDLSHYHPYREAVKLDQECLDAFIAIYTSLAERAEACGMPAALVLMHIAKMKSWASKLVQYQNSGDVSGDKSRVVGYGSVAYFTRDN